MKILLALLLLSSNLFSASGETFESYTKRRIESAKAKGQEYVEMKVPSKFSDEAVQFAIGCVMEGYYVEVNKKEGFEVLTVGWSEQHIEKQKRIFSLADRYTDKLIEGYDECPEMFYLLGMWSTTYYTGNFYHGCGETFLKSVVENVDSLRYEDFDYSNMQICLILKLSAKGYTLKKYNSGEAFNVFEVKPKYTEKPSKNKGVEGPSPKLNTKVPF